MYPGGFDEEVYNVMAAVYSGMLASLLISLLCLVCYVLMSVAVYTIAKRRELKSPWLAWIPVANSWLLGSIADQYRYVTRGENKSKRKVLLVLSALCAVLAVVICAFLVQSFLRTAHVVLSGTAYSEDQLMQAAKGPIMAALNLVLPLLGGTLAYIIVYYLTLWDVYQSLDPMKSTVYLVLSILFVFPPVFFLFQDPMNSTVYLVLIILFVFPPVVFLFFNRYKENGMPPRKETQPTPSVIPERDTWMPQPEQPPQNAQEPWQPVQNRKDPWEN